MTFLDENQQKICARFADLALPRHTSYPTAPHWQDDYGPSEFEEDLQQLDPARGVSLYVHIPFCRQLCFYCGCTKEIIPDEVRACQDPADPFLSTLATEVALVRRNFSRPVVHQLHLGGGTPTFLRPKQLAQLWECLTNAFAISPEAEIACEADPRVTTADHLSTLHGLGFNRLSIGVQDFDPTVQKAVNREQPFALVQNFVDQARNRGFPSLNFDLIYGLPFQTSETLTETLTQVIKLNPDRIAFYRLAVLPQIFKWQKSFVEKDLATGARSVALFAQIVDTLGAAGYELIGFDHFAKATDPLSIAAKNGTLVRSFQGMSTHKEMPTIGFGPSAISSLPASFAQNAKRTKDWYHHIAKGLATIRGLRLDSDDLIRRDLLQKLYGRGEIVFSKVLDQDFAAYFRQEMETLKQLEREGLVTISDSGFRLTDGVGRTLVRVVASVFDRYLPKDAWMKGIEGASQAG